MTGSDRRPSLVVFAGPNGSGKTTLTRAMVHEHPWLEGHEYINADEIAEKEFDDWNSAEAQLKAAVKAGRLRHEYAEAAQDFAFETVLSSPHSTAVLEKARDIGYFIRVYFVCTDDPDINVQRVSERYAAGGHDVPEERVRARYERSVVNLMDAIGLADRVYLLDNSVADCGPRLVLRIRDSDVTKVYDGAVPSWCQNIIDTIRSNSRS